MLSHAWVLSRMGLFFHAWIGSLTYAFSRMGHFLAWVYFFSHGLTLSRILSHAWAFSRIGLLFHAWIGSLTYAFSLMGFSTNDLLFHAWIGSLTFAFSRMGSYTYVSIFSRMDWLSHVCFLTHGLFHEWVYFFTYGLALSRMGFSTYGSIFSRMDWLSHVSDL